MNLLELINEQKRDIDYALCNLQLAWIYKIEAADIPYENIEPYEDEVSNCRQEVLNRHTTSIIQLLEVIAEMVKDSNRISCGACVQEKLQGRALVSHCLGCQQTNGIINNLTEVIQKVKQL